jgi:hypothetical protein
LISVSLALIINFYSPEITKNTKSMGIIINKENYQQIGFPYQYFQGEFLSEDDAKYRLRMIFI